MLFADRHAENLGKIRVMSKLISTMIRYLEYENANIGRAKDAEESVRNENQANGVLVENAVIARLSSGSPCRPRARVTGETPRTGLRTPNCTSHTNYHSNTNIKTSFGNISLF